MPSDERACRWPTPQEFVDEWEERSPEERLEAAAAIIASGQRASRCAAMNHDALQEELRFWQARLTELDAPE